MRSGSNSSRGLDSSSSLEIALDQAIAHRFSSVQERSSKKRRNSPVPTSLALTVTPKQTALALVPSRLAWRGIEVSDEFQEYAARVARGEQLAPFRGPVLSRPCPEFPWTTPSSSATSPTPTLPEYPGRARSLKALVCFVAAVGSVAGALGVGAGGKAQSVADTFATPPVQASAALMPTPKAAPDPPSAELESAAPDDALGGADPALGPAASAIASKDTTQLAPAAPQPRARSPEVLRPPAASTAAATLGKSPLPDASHVSISPPTAATSNRNASTLATPVPVPSPRDSTLFSENAPF
jgi:hypothetical protein